MQQVQEISEKIKYLFDRGEYEKANILLPELFKVDFPQASFWKFKIFGVNTIGAISKTEYFDVANQIIEDFKNRNLTDSKEFFMILVDKGYIIYQMVNKEEYMQFIKELDTYYEQLKANKIVIPAEYELKYEFVKSRYFPLEDQINFIEKNLDKINSLDSLDEKIRYYHHYARYLSAGGNLDDLIQVGKIYVALSRQYINPYPSLLALNNLAMYHAYAGNFRKAHKIIEEALSISENNPDKSQINQLSLIRLKGHLLDTNGWFYYEENCLEKALEFFDKAETVLQEIHPNGAWLLTDIYLGQFNCYIQYWDLEGLTNFVNKFEEFAEKQKGEVLFVYAESAFYLAKAQLLVKKGRTRDKAEALTLLEKIIKTERLIFYKDILYPAIITLISILLTEYSETMDQSILDEIQLNIEKLSKIRLMNMQFEKDILTSKILIIKGEIDKSKALLEESLLKSKNFNYSKYEVLITKELTRINNEQEKWKSNEYTNKLEMSQIVDYINEATKSILKIDGNVIEINPH